MHSLLVRVHLVAKCNLLKYKFTLNSFMSIYLVTAYCWGHTNDHNYLVHVTHDEGEACAIAKETCEDRAGRYGVQVMRHDGSEQVQVAYFPSRCKEQRPEHNHYLDMLSSIGSRVHEAVLSGGVVWDAPADGSHGPNVPREVELPQWIVEIVREEKTSCRVSELVEERDRNQPARSLEELRAYLKSDALRTQAHAVSVQAQQQVDAELEQGLHRKQKLLQGRPSHALPD